MRFAPDVIVDLTLLPELINELPFSALLAGFLRGGFEPEASRRLLAVANARLGRPLLRPGAVDDGGLLVEEAVLFPDPGAWWCVLQQGGARWRTRLEPEAVTVVADFLRMASHARSLEEARAAWPFDEESWEDALFTAAPPENPWPEPSGPGLYRREHASVLVSSRETSVLVDPIPLQRRLSHIGKAPGNLPPESVGAVAITHGHVDHWHLPSLLAHLPRQETPVLVPRVPRVNLLTLQDFSQVLRACGQEAWAAAWGEARRVGDIQVDVLPFYGEQPTAAELRPVEGVRSWGNCYRFSTEDFSCLVLVDSGQDPEGRMEEVVARSRQQRGPVDVVLACQREFLSPFFGGLSHYWAALSWDSLRRLYGEHHAGRLRSSTAGPTGIAELCVAAGARYFLPYANGFEGVGRGITDVGWGEGEPSEAQCNARVREELARRGATTEVIDWKPGDVARFERGRLVLERGPER